MLCPIKQRGKWEPKEILLCLGIKIYGYIYRRPSRWFIEELSYSHFPIKFGTDLVQN